MSQGLFDHRVSAYESLMESLTKLERWQETSGKGFHGISCVNPYVSKYVTWEGVYMDLARLRHINPLFQLLVANRIDRRVNRLMRNIERAVDAVTSWRIA